MAKPERVPVEEFTYSQLSDTIIQRMSHPTGYPIEFNQLRSCKLAILAPSTQMTVDECVKCVIVCGPCEGSVFIRDCVDCVFFLSCGQFRMRDCQRCTVFLNVSTDPCIETSKSIIFSPLKMDYKRYSGFFSNCFFTQKITFNHQNYKK